jgi:branched-subunit amino acid transport protein
MSGTEALVIGGMALVTFMIRYPLLALVGRWTMPPLVARALKYIPVAVLTAIIAPATLYPSTPALQWPYLLGAAAAALTMWRTHNLLLTIGAGMGVLFAAQLGVRALGG